MWLSLKPAMLITLVATGGSLYHVIRRCPPGRRRRVCRTCGYDLRFAGMLSGVRQCPYRRSNPATLI